MGQLEKRFPRYSSLLRLYPEHYRKRYGEQMLQTLADMLDDAANDRARSAIWLRTALDLPLSLTRQQTQFLGGIMTHETPAYIKRTGTIGALLLVPFFVLVVVGSFVPGHLYDTWLWNRVVIVVWLLALPGLALLLSGFTFLKWLGEQKQRQKRGFWHSLSDLPHNWPILGVGILAAGIIGLAFLHDSVHCVTGNPVSEIQQWHGTWNCITQG